MPAKKRIKTKYAGVYYVESTSADGRRKEKIYYIMYRVNGKLVEEKAGRQYKDDMTPARAAGLRASKIDKKLPTNNDKRRIAKKVQWTVQRLADEYFSHRPDNRSARTDKGRYDIYLKKPFGNKSPSEINQLSVDRIRINLLKQKSPQTVKHILALLSRIIRFGTDRGLCAPMTFTIKMPKVDNIKTEDLTPQQLQNLIETLNTTKYQTAATMMMVALFTGMRRGEIFNLKWDHIDFDHGFIHIHEPKGGVSQKIPLNANSRDIFTSIEQSSEYVFPARNGGPRKDANKDFNRIKTEAGLPKDFRPMHGLRHVYATILASSGSIDMLTLQKLLTHKDQRMTQRYIHYRDDALKRAADKTDDIMNGIMAAGKQKTA